MDTEYEIRRLQFLVDELGLKMRSHRHNNVDGTFRIPEKITSYIRLIPDTTNVSVANVVGGDVLIPISGYIYDIHAHVDTAGTTGTMLIDVNKNATTIMQNKLLIDSTEKNTLTSSTTHVLKNTSLNSGDILTFDVDQIHGTPAKGLTIILTVSQ